MPTGKEGRESSQPLCFIFSEAASYVQGSLLIFPHSGYEMIIYALEFGNMFARLLCVYMLRFLMSFKHNNNPYYVLNGKEHIQSKMLQMCFFCS